MSVLRVIAGSDRFQPMPNGPLPAPESYDRESWGPNPERPGDVAIGTLREPVPVTGFAANFSPMPRTAPPPFGKDNCGAATPNFWSEEAWWSAVLLRLSAINLVLFLSPKRLLELRDGAGYAGPGNLARNRAGHAATGVLAASDGARAPTLP